MFAMTTSDNDDPTKRPVSSRAQVPPTAWAMLAEAGDDEVKRAAQRMSAIALEHAGKALAREADRDRLAGLARRIGAGPGRTAQSEDRGSSRLAPLLVLLRLRARDLDRVRPALDLGLHVA
jgi:hypothetical protein